jgi:hypothetical protein
MAISGAAASPHMGTLTSSRYMMLLAMLNIRLGYWVRRPKRSSLIGGGSSCFRMQADTSCVNSPAA